MNRQYWGSKKDIFNFIKIIPNSTIYEDPDENTLLDLMTLGFEQKTNIIILSETRNLKRLDKLQDTFIFATQEIEGIKITDDLLYEQGCKYYNLRFTEEEKNSILASPDGIIHTLEKIAILGVQYVTNIRENLEEDPIGYIRSTLFKLKNWKQKKYDKDFGKFIDEDRYYFLKFFLCTAEDLFKKTGDQYITHHCKNVLKLTLKNK